jgi:hypothetical protein
MSMPSRILLVACGLTALAVSGCGIAAKPLAGTSNLVHAAGYHARVDSPRSKHVACMEAAGLHVRLFEASGARPGIQVGTPPSGPTVIFEPTPQDATGVQIVGQAQGAEQIGSALLFVNRAPDSVLTTVENCLAIGVSG